MAGQKKASDSPPTMSAIKRVFGLGAAFAAALNGTMVMPLIVLALHRIPGIDEGTATAIAAAELAGIALYGLLAPRVIRNAGRITALCGLLALIAGEAACQYLDGIAPLAAARLLAGLGEGALFSLITTEVAAEANAERIWGQINLVGGLAMGALLYGLSTLPPTGDRGSIFLWLAALGVFVAPWVLLLKGRERRNAAATPRSLAKSHIVLILLVVLLVYAVQAGQWAVSGFMGELAHMQPERVGRYLAVSSIAGFAGAIVPSLTRNPAHRLRLVLLGFLVMALAVLAFFNWRSDAAFLWGQIGVNVGFYMVTPFVIGLLTENDQDGALVLRTLIVALVGAAFGTALAGAALSGTGPGAFGGLCAAIIAVSTMIAALVFRRLPAALLKPPAL
jgi:MFS transporter, DHA1 family, inner membrane transport protein